VLAGGIIGVDQLVEISIERDSDQPIHVPNVQKQARSTQLSPQEQLQMMKELNS